MSDENELVWQSSLRGYSAFKPHILFGKPVLSFWTGNFLALPWATNFGRVDILDQSYRIIYSISISAEEQHLVPAAGLDPAKVPSFVDGHEASITAENTMLVTAYNTTPYDLSSFGGARNGWMHDSLFFELDVTTNKVLRRWSALEHVDKLGLTYDALEYPPGEMGRNKTHPYDFFHVNSVDKFQDGSYLVSSMHTCSVYRVAADGTIQWILQVSEWWVPSE
jgi:hypothetical protein